MIHAFSVELAVEYGLNESIILQTMAFWIAKNKANGKHERDGVTWTYNSLEAWRKLHPYWSKGQVERLLDSMVKNGLLKKGNFNLTSYDRTCWWAFGSPEIEAAISRNQEMDFPKRPNGFPESKKSLNSTSTVTVPVTSTPTPSAPSLAEVIAEGDRILLPKTQCEAFFHHYEGNGWMTGQVPIQKWKAKLVGWKNNWQAEVAKAKTKGHRSSEQFDKVLYDGIEHRRRLSDGNLQSPINGRWFTPLAKFLGK